MLRTYLAAIERHWLGLNAWFERRIDAFPRAQVETPPSGLWPFFWSYIGPVWPAYVLLAVLSLIGAVIEIAMYAFVGTLVDQMTAAQTPQRFFVEHGWQLAGMAMIGLLLRPAFSALADLTKNQVVSGPVNSRIRWLAHRYVLRQNLTFFQNDFAGRIATRVMQAGSAVRDVATNVCDVVVWVGVHWIGAIALFLVADWRLMIPLTLWLIAYIGALWYFVPRIERMSNAVSDARSMVTGRVVDSYTNIATVKLFAHTTREDDYALEAMQDHLAKYQRQLRLNTLMEIVLWSLNSVLLVSVTGTVLWLWSIGAVSIGAMAVATGLAMRLMNMSGWFMWMLSGIFENIGTIHESMESIARPLGLTDAPAAMPLRVSKGAITYQNIGFHYGKSGGVIDDLSLSIAAGEKVGIVGRSGAGKSTLVNVLLRFYDLESGRILIDGQDIAGITQESLRAQIGMVTQDTSLLHRSVLDNIRYGQPDATEAQAIAAARRAQAHEFILGLSDHRDRTGYAAHVGERGVKLSGGQRQRIAIARVLLKDAPILILDEATSALDSEVEAAIQEQLYNLMQGKSVIAIAHRLSTIAAMDRLVIMDLGRIVEQGSHQELLVKGGLYADLWARQSGGFLLRGDERIAAE